MAINLKKSNAIPANPNIDQLQEFASHFTFKQLKAIMPKKFTKRQLEKMEKQAALVDEIRHILMFYGAMENNGYYFQYDQVPCIEELEEQGIEAWPVAYFLDKNGNYVDYNNFNFCVQGVADMPDLSLLDSIAYIILGNFNLAQNFARLIDKKYYSLTYIDKPIDIPTDHPLKGDFFLEEYELPFLAYSKWSKYDYIRKIFQRYMLPRKNWNFLDKYGFKVKVIRDGYSKRIDLEYLDLEGYHNLYEYLNSFTKD